MSELRLRFKYVHGTADQNRLDLYDGTTSMSGVARALTIATHAFVNGEVRTRGDSAHDARLYILPFRRGSFEFEAIVWMVGAVSSGLFYDFLRACFQEAVGLQDEAEQQSAALQKRVEPTIGELPAVLESPLRDVHRPIREEPEMTLSVMRPRGEKLITFDKQTDSFLQPQEVDLAEPVIGNVTRYNTLSRWGKFYDRRAGRVISFFLPPTASERERSLITWSLHERNMGREGTLLLSGSAMIAPSGLAKRYNVSAVLPGPT